MGALEVADGFVGNWAEDAVGNKVESVLEGGDVAPSAAFTDCLHFGLMCYELMIVMSFRGGSYCRIHNGILIRTPPLRK